MYLRVRGGTSGPVGRSPAGHGAGPGRLGVTLPEIAGQVRDRGPLWSVLFLVPAGWGRAGRPRRGQTEDVLDALYDLGETVPVKTTEAHRR